MKTINRIQKTAMVILAMGMLSGPAWGATDYSSMTNEELAALRGTMRESTVEEREAFRTEWQSRVTSMTTEERQGVIDRPDNALRDGAGMQNGAERGRVKGKADYGMRDAAAGDGAGNAFSGSRGGGRGMGRGNR